MTSLRNLRKYIYKLQEGDTGASKALLTVLLSGYKAVDYLFLKRAKKIDRSAEKVYSKNKNFFCTIVPKCGSRTIIYGLQKASDDGGFDIAILEQDISEFTEGYDDCFKFAIVRDPWARAYSCYSQKIRISSPIKQALHFTGRPGLNKDMSFEDFVRWLCSDPGQDCVADRHWASQSSVLGLDLGMTYDFVGKLENMDSDMALIAKKIGLQPDTFSKKRNSTTKKKNAHLDHYTPELIELVAQRYKDDIEAFGYEKPQLS